MESKFACHVQDVIRGEPYGNVFLFTIFTPYM